MTCKYDEIKDYKTAFECFRQRFLEEKKSIFQMDSEKKILDDDGIKYLVDNFINKGYTGNTTATEKFFHQLTNKHFIKNGVEITDEAQKKAIEILAHAVWLWRLPASNTDTKNRKKSVMEILSFNQEWSDEEYLKDNKFFKNNYEGFAMPGIGYNTNKANELAYIIRFFQSYLKNHLLEKKEKCLKKYRNIQIRTVYKYDYDKDKDKDKKNKYLLSQISKPKIEKSKVSVPNALLHLIKPERYERIIADNHKEQIQKVFAPIFGIETEDIDNDIYEIKEKIENLLTGAGIDIKKGIDFYDNSIVRMWQSDLDFVSKNIIIHGAPGTGKTFLTLEAIKTRRLIENNSEYELVQFHPSYSYEDFIEGIRPIKMHKNGQMEFALKNGIFKQMCVDAFEELKRFENKVSVLEDKIDTLDKREEDSLKKELKDLKEKGPSKFYFIADEINRAELSRVFGELLLCLEDDKRLSIKDGKVLGAKIRTQYSNLWDNNDKYIVVRVDKNDKLSDDGDAYFGVPENIYFIGTMNDIDRSVESFDMALRRRFVWKHYRFNEYPILEKYKDIEKDGDKIERYVQVCKDINDFIISEKGLDLASSYELGHSYFMKAKKLKQVELNRIWDEHIAPILIEYLRSEYDEKHIEKKLKDAQKLFKI